MSYTVKAALVIAKAADKSDVYLYRGVLVPAHIPASEVERLLRGGFIEKQRVPAKSDSTEQAGDQKPNESWTNAQIVEWADAHDVDLDGATTKADMLAAIAASES